MPECQVSSIQRTITITLTPQEAKTIMSDFNHKEEPSYPGKILYGALASVANYSESGGH